MDAILQAQFQRVETALNTLIDSITSYNPSTQAAVNLVAADDELSKGLEQLAVHQANYARILSLRQTVTSLEGQLKGSLTALADLRKELLATPATTFPASSRHVPFDEVLQFAKNLAKYTAPSAIRPPPAKEVAPPEQTDQADVNMSNGVGTPANRGANDDPAKEKGDGKAQSTLTQAQKDWLEEASRAPFMPWPTDNIIRGGALGHIQGMINRGQDPATVLGPAEQEAEDKRRAEEVEREKQEQQEREAEARRRESAYVSGARPTQPPQAVFQGLDMYDPDEDE
ncbi:uncharacterized protein BDZ99DRAFT_464576 [Mytilinidion resinicola]|uniref:Mediator of RNA polymerase II transcription subunit 4 n=1 Tax=Mytilinidion resinicola TaxID=574789 RepID=A0A6A6YIB1_9PEZI|nr:uncharacterized protein BDZ99DRAFT_464576 [Mytilinidion resinicola]KAF2807657.1 hypothetical protein BDZ99DRAFT_464576 [Mytilinidion resinicola]